MTEQNHGNGRGPRKEGPMSDLEIHRKQSLRNLEVIMERLGASAVADSMPPSTVVLKGPAQGIPQPAQGVGVCVTFRMDWLLTADSQQDAETRVASLLRGFDVSGLKQWHD